MDLEWRDEQLAWGEAGAKPRVYLENDAQAALDQMWWPDLTIVNEVEKRETESLVLLIHPDGRVTYEERFGVVIHAELDLRSFPFDRQRFELVLESLAWDSRQLQLVPNPAKTGFDTAFRIPEWAVTGVESFARTRPEVRGEADFSTVTLGIDATRASQHYLLRFLLPLMVVMLLTWSAFWIPASNRGRAGFIALLSIVASHSVIATQLPRIAYVTFIDLTLFIGYAYAAVLIVEANWVARLEHSGDDGARKRAKVIDRRTRWLLPLCAALALGIAIVVLLR
jgi:hypothetical protein